MRRIARRQLAGELRRKQASVNAGVIAGGAFLWLGLLVLDSLLGNNMETLWLCTLAIVIGWAVFKGHALYVARRR